MMSDDACVLRALALCRGMEPLSPPPLSFVPPPLFLLSPTPVHALPHQNMTWERPMDAASAARLRRGYYASVTYTDHNIGQILDAVEPMR